MTLPEFNPVGKYRPTYIVSACTNFENTDCFTARDQGIISRFDPLCYECRKEQNIIRNASKRLRRKSRRADATPQHRETA